VLGSYLVLRHQPQERDFTCIPACVRMVLLYFGLDLAEEEIAGLLGTDETGTLFPDIANVDALGFDAPIGKSTLHGPGELTAAGQPVIARIKTTHLPRYPVPPWVPHGVVVVGVTRGSVWIHDPAQPRGPEAVPRNAFAAAWRAGQDDMAVIRPRIFGA
jgi:ABC-type bacteriocin/lantibiotic exporter with double-glycine peptidase domain